MVPTFSSLGWLVSPTRKYIDRKKLGGATLDEEALKVFRGNVLKTWSWRLFAFEVILCGGLVVLSAFGMSLDYLPVELLACAYGYSRVNEIAYAFYKDPLDSEKTSNLLNSDRVRMAMRSYFGLGLNFALLYFFLPVPGLFSPEFRTFLDALYFSGVTLATLGYGDITPAHQLSKLLAMYEVSTGILLIAVAIATYAGGLSEDRKKPTISGQTDAIDSQRGPLA